MLDHDDIVGDLLDLLDELGIADDTIVVYSTDNGPHLNTWPDSGMTPFRNEKNSNWEGAYRVPCVVRWPGRIEPGTVLNGIVSHNDWFVTLLAAAGVPDIADQLKAGADLGGVDYRVHLDGHNQLPYLLGEQDESAAQHFFYVSDDGDLTALRFDNWKFVFMEQRCRGHVAGLGGALHRAAGPEDLQPAHRPLRAGRHHLEHLLRLAARPRLADDPGAGVRRQDGRDPRRVPAPRQEPASFRSTRCSPSCRPGSPARDPDAMIP
jgi:arylsulfatase A-like enzyme